MKIGTSTSWPARVLRLLMLALGIVATPSVGMDAMQRPHCAQHERAAHGSHDSTASSETGYGRAWTPQHTHRCSHCPASECARVSTCAGSSASAIAPKRAVGVDPHSHRVAVELRGRQVDSIHSPPDTPPPQLTA